MPMQDRHLPLRLVIEPTGPAARPGAAGPATASAVVEPWIDATGREFGYCRVEGDGYHVCLYDFGSFTFTRHSTAVRGAPERGVALDAFYALFWREIAPCVLQQHSWEILHASGLVVGGACIALCGNSQMGKSTLAHAWRRRGGCVYADESIPFRVRERSVAIGPLPFWIRLRPASLRYFNGSEGSIDERSQPLRAESPPAAVNGGVLRAIYLLDHRRDAEGSVRLEAIPPPEALPALLEQAICLTLRDRARNREMVETYITLADTLPTYCLSYPTGLHHVDAVLDRLADHVTHQAAGTASGRSPR
jgi:hypothetical protein